MMGSTVMYREYARWRLIGASDGAGTMNFIFFRDDLPFTLVLVAMIVSKGINGSVQRIQGEHCCNASDLTDVP